MSAAADGPSQHLISRRRLLGGAAGFAAVGGLGVLGRGSPTLASSGVAARSAGSTSAATSLPVVKSPAAPAFHSRPDLLPPQMQVTDLQSDAADGYVLITPSAVPTARGVTLATQIAEGLGQPGLMVLSGAGQLVWFKPSTVLATNLQVQTYRGERVLTYWEGAEGAGMGFGTGHILDSSYRQIAVVRAGNGVRADLHELQLTPQSTALVTGYVKRAADLTSMGGARNASIWDGVVQEIDVATGKVLLDWRSFDHVPLSETHAALTKPPFDYFHPNSIAPYGDDELIVSSRNTWTLYRINRKTGAVIARINGKSSDYKIGPEADFYWQHHVRQHPGGLLTVFDDGAAPEEEPESRGLVLAINDSARTVRLVKAFTHPAHLLAQFEGSMQLLPGGGAFVGWGGEPYYSQFAPNGEIVLDGRFPTNDQSYRAFRSPWVGRPAAPPDVVVAKDALGGRVVYVSWNGDTETASWQVLSGNAASSLRPLATVAKAGFETAVTVRPTGRLLAVAALDATGRRLGVSGVVSA